MGTGIDLARLRARLAGLSGRAFWRSLEDVSQTAEFRAFVENELPGAASAAQAPDRRQFLRLMAASLALGGLTSCGDDDGRDHEVGYVREPTRGTPSGTLSYASSTLIDGFANGILVTTRDGRPIKVEGNPEHPWSRGGTDIFGQASVLGLYDPDRSQAARYLGRPADLDQFRGAMQAPFAGLRADSGRGLRLLTGPVTSPSLAAQIQALQGDFAEMRWHIHAPVARDAIYEGTDRAFGSRLETRFRFDRAEVIVALDGDFLDPGPQQVGMARDWVAARRASAVRGGLVELYAAASTPSLTSARADHAITAGPRAIAQMARDLLADVFGQPAAPPADDAASRWRAAAAAALARSRGRGVLLCGITQPPDVQELVHRANAALGNLGETVFYTPPALASAEPMAALVEAMLQGDVSTLVMLDTNPVYTTPGDLAFAGALRKVRLKIHAGLYADETAANSDWHVPLAHPLEAWGDARSLDGTVSLIQPTIAPLYGGLTASEVLATLTDPSPRRGLELLRAHWRGVDSYAEFESRWRQMLLSGFVPDTALSPEDVSLTPANAVAAAPAASEAQGGLDLLFRPDPTVWDGSVANNGWLQELPKPLTKVTWENVIAISPALAERERLAIGDLVTLTVDGRTAQGPVWVQPGQATDAVTVYLGYGRQTPEMLFSGLGYDAYSLRSAAAPWRTTGLVLHTTDQQVTLATTQDHQALDGEGFVRVLKVGKTETARDSSSGLPTFYGPRESDGRAWGMVIDLDSCIGCNACVVACQSENNSPVVGKEQVIAGREMHWLRIDRYYSGGLANPDTHFMPVPCMHCEQAPCEVACPVEATVHDHEGLNLMVYNRCVGTRACSGYCPYKVRRFNWYDYNASQSDSVQLRANPEVTVRARGVMEKCTYCVQRIAEARINADKDDRPIGDGEVQTACQGACPTRAIVFGDLADPHSAVAQWRGDPRNYTLLGELNTRPRTTYLAKLAPDGAQEG